VWVESGFPAATMIYFGPQAEPRPAAIAILPADYRPGDALAARFGLHINEELVTYLAALPNVKVLTRPATSLSVRPTHVVELMVARGAPEAEVLVRIHRSTDAAVIWERSLSGRPIAVETALIADVQVVLASERIWPHDRAM
jgi:hypothetical protein